MEYLVLDIATTAIDNAVDFCDDDISAPAHYKDEAKIADYIATAKAKQLDKAALDLDLARLTGLAMITVPEAKPAVLVNRDTTEEYERFMLRSIAELLLNHEHCRLVSYNGLRFDWPLLMRRAWYLDVAFPAINLDRYRTPHVDVWDRLSYHGAVSARSLTWYAKRLGWTDLQKTLSGAEEARVVQTGRWDDLASSLSHDARACERLAIGLGYLEPREYLEYRA